MIIFKHIEKGTKYLVKTKKNPIILEKEESVGNNKTFKMVSKPIEELEMMKNIIKV